MRTPSGSTTPIAAANFEGRLSVAGGRSAPWLDHDGANLAVGPHQGEGSLTTQFRRGPIRRAGRSGLQRNSADTNTELTAVIHN